MSTTTLAKPARTTGHIITVVVLGLFVLAGLGAGIYRFVVGLGEATNLTDGVPWGIWIGFDFSLIALGGSGFTLATAVHVLRQDKLKPALRPSVLAGLLAYVSVLLILILDLGRPDRFYHFLIFFNVHSPMFEIAWCILLYSIVLFVETSPFYFEKIGKKKPASWVHKAVIPISVIGLVLSSLHQSTLGTLYLNMPYRLDTLWYAPIMSILFFTSSIVAGLSVAMVAYGLSTRIRGKETEPVVMNSLAKGAAWVALVYSLMKIGDWAFAGELPLLFAFDRASLLMLAELGLGMILPMILFFIPSLRAKRSVQWLGASLFIAGVLFNRMNATWFSMAPRAAGTYMPHILEWLSLAGVLGALGLAWYLGIRGLAIFKGDAPEEA
ncbi:MAG: polysulfide reductase NrfD [Anaerolineales bacterium]|jgi:Ni/Fe-hydrogenase subunit HybB-like protein